MSIPQTGTAQTYPVVRQVVLDCTDASGLAEFYRELLGMRYRPGDEPPAGDWDDAEWLVLRPTNESAQLAFQRVTELPEPTWPEGPHPQMLHLDMTVQTADELLAQRSRVLALGGRELLDRFDDPDEPLYVFADPAGHPFCIFVG